MGLDANWDLRNYHYYNAYAFLTGRRALDVAPGQLQTFLNPLLDLPFFWMAQTWPPVWVGAALGLVHGLNLTLLGVIFIQATRWPDARTRWGVGMLIVWLGLRAPGFLSELGGTMNDDLVSLFVLLPVWLLLRAPASPGAAAGDWQVALAGCVMGAGVGLKPTVAPFALASGVGLLWLWSTARSRGRAFLIYGVTGVLGTLATTGFWWWEMWTDYGNPLFPYMNDVFQSPFIPATSYTAIRFVPQALWEYPRLAFGVQRRPVAGVGATLSRSAFRGSLRPVVAVARGAPDPPLAGQRPPCGLALGVPSARPAIPGGVRGGELRRVDGDVLGLSLLDSLGVAGAGAGPRRPRRHLFLRAGAAGGGSGGGPDGRGRISAAELGTSLMARALRRRSATFATWGSPNTQWSCSRERPRWPMSFRSFRPRCASSERRETWA